MAAVEIETLDWVDWFDNKRLLAPIGYLPPAGFDELHCEKHERSARAAGLKWHTRRRSRGGSTHSRDPSARKRLDHLKYYQHLRD